MTRLKIPYGTTTALTNNVVQEREVAYDTTLARLVYGDGSAEGGVRLANYSELAAADGAMDARVDALEAKQTSTAMTAVVQAVTVALARVALGFPAALDAFWTAVSKPAARDAINVPKVFHVKDYGALCDARTVFDGAMTNGSAVLTSATAAFTSADVGKSIGVMGARSDSGSSKRPLVTTISVFTSSTQVTLAATAQQTVSNAEVCFGTDDAAAVQDAVDAADTFGGGRVYVPEDTIIGTELDFSGVHHVQLCSDAFAHAVDETGFSDDLPYSLSQIAGKLIWLGADGGYVVKHDIGQWTDGSWVKPQGNGFTNICVDCFGRASGVLRSFSALSTRIHRLVGARFTTYGLNFGTTSNATAAAAMGNTASSYVIVSESVLVNRGAPVFGAKALALWGDKGDSGGNFNYGNFTNCHFVIENDGSLENLRIEQVDTTDFIGCVWNARMVLHAADTGNLSLYNLIHPDTELITDAPSAASTTVTLPVGFYTLTVTSGTGGTAAVSGGTATTANTGTASNGTPDDFEVTVAGTVTITRTGTLTAWSLKARNRNCQSRTVSLHSCSGLVVAKKSALGAGFHAQNHYISGYDVENIVTMPIIEPGADVYIESNARTDQSVGAMQWGGDIAGLQVALTSNQTIANGSQSALSWPTPVVESLDLWDSGSPTRVTFGHATNPHQANNVRRARFDAQATFASSATGYRFLSLLKNGTTRYFLATQAGVGGGNITILSGSIMLPIAPGDYFELQMLQDSGGDLNALAEIASVGGASRLDVTCF